MKTQNDLYFIGQVIRFSRRKLAMQRAFESMGRTFHRQSCGGADNSMRENVRTAAPCGILSGRRTDYSHLAQPGLAPEPLILLGAQTVGQPSRREVDVVSR